jgi:hypothetical protein
MSRGQECLIFWQMVLDAGKSETVRSQTRFTNIKKLLDGLESFGPPESNTITEEN